MTTTTKTVVGSPARVRVTAFVDWAAQMHNAGTSEEPRPHEQASRTLARTARGISRALATEEARFRVSLRLYHGWHKGWQATEHLKATMQAVEAADFVALSSSLVSFSRTVHYGHTLLSALPERQHRNPPIHLANTVRAQGRDQIPREKMVDTALAADLLSWARFQSDEWAIVLAEDDDMVPPLLAAEAWLEPTGGRAMLLRKRASSQYTKLAGLLRNLT